MASVLDYNTKGHDGYYNKADGSGPYVFDGTNFYLRIGGSVGLFANRPLTASVGARYFATDLGTGIELVMGAGGNWKPVTGSAPLYVDAANVLITTAGSFLLKSYRIKGNLLSVNGGLRATVSGRCAITTATPSFAIRYNADGSSGGSSLAALFPTTTALYMRMQGEIHNTGVLNNQSVGNSSFSGFGLSTASENTSNIDTTADTFVVVTASLAAGGDSITLRTVTIEWFEP